ncbi:MAG TPA: glycosyl hydrolase [Terracidiphilus sp.]|nr:glycosyl hydrolase [Terracidiphilus sp.]
MKLIRLLRRVSIFLVLGYFISTLSSQSSVALRNGFEAPPQSAKLRCYWWWLNGNTTEAAILRDLTEMKAKGYGGAILVDANGADQGGNHSVPSGPLFGSPQWVKLFLYALSTSKKLGLEISLNATSGWNLGGPGVRPEDAAKVLTFSRTIVIGGSQRSIQLAAPPMKNGFYRQIAVLAYPLRHGTPLPGEPASSRRAILDLDHKTTEKDTGLSMQLSSKTLRELPSVSGEEDMRTSDVVDVTAFTADGAKLDWSFPFGTWEVLRVGYTDSGSLVSTSSGAWQGLMMDYMSRTAFDHYWNQVLMPLIVDAKPYIGSSLCYLVEDSWEELGGENWTEGFRDEFRKRRGYDPLPYLPTLAGRIVNDRATTNRFLYDLRRTVADLVAENHYDYFAQLAAHVGLGTHSESGGPHGVPIDALETFRNSSFPQTEFWAMSDRHRVTDEERFFVKEASSAAHIYGKPFVAAEGFTSLGLPWSESPGLNLKPTFDQALTEGLNRLYWHEFTSEPQEFGLPGREYFAGTHLNPNTTWWRQAGPVLLAMNRAQFLMQQGRPVSDLLYYAGEQIPEFARLKSDDPAHVLPGYDYDVTSQDALLHRMIPVSGGVKTPEGLSYRVLALPRSGFLSLASLIWIEKYVREGGLLVGPQPTRALGLLSVSEEKQYKAIADRMWSGCKGVSIALYGAGRIYCTLDAHAALEAFGVQPDLEVEGPAQLDFVHRQTSDADIYFVRNKQNVPAQAILNFRIHGRAPALWQIDSGAMAAAPVYRENGRRTEIPLSFPAYGSVFIVFEHASPVHAVRVERDGVEVFPSILPGSGLVSSTDAKIIATDPGTYRLRFSDGSSHQYTVSEAAGLPKFGSTWTLAFPPNWGAPASMRISKFVSWTESPDPGIRYFSGTATYRATLQVPGSSLKQDNQLWLDLGEVREVATVLIDGKPVATLWHPPFRVRIDQALHVGDNSVEIEVSNLWPNRLIGDSQPGAKHYATTNIDNYESNSPLLPSGLLTEITIYATHTLSAVPAHP